MSHLGVGRLRRRLRDGGADGGGDGARVIFVYFLSCTFVMVVYWAGALI